MEEFVSLLSTALIWIIRWILFIAASIIMFPAWFLTIVIHPYWIKLFNANKDKKKLLAFNLTSIFTALRLIIFGITGLIMLPAWLIAFNLNDAWLGLIKD